MKDAIPSAPRWSVSTDGVVYGLNGLPLKPWTTTGYQMVKVAGQKRYVHDLVLETFVGSKPSGACVRHGQLGSLNNSLVNICYGTYSENELDKVHDGTHQQAKKTHCPQGHEYTPENTRIYTGRGYTERLCRQCQRTHVANFKNRKRQKVSS